MKKVHRHFSGIGKAEKESMGKLNWDRELITGLALKISPPQRKGNTREKEGIWRGL